MRPTGRSFRITFSPLKVKAVACQLGPFHFINVVAWSRFLQRMFSLRSSARHCCRMSSQRRPGHGPLTANFQRGKLFPSFFLPTLRNFALVRVPFIFRSASKAEMPRTTDRSSDAAKCGPNGPPLKRYPLFTCTRRRASMEGGA